MKPKSESLNGTEFELAEVIFIKKFILNFDFQVIQCKIDQSITIKNKQTRQKEKLVKN